MLSVQRGICRQASKRLSSAVGSDNGSGIQGKVVKYLQRNSQRRGKSKNILVCTHVTVSIDITSQAKVSSQFTHVPES